MDCYVKNVMDAVTDKLTGLLGDNLAGVYLHGSAAFGCYCQGRSDIDFIVVTKQEPSFAQKKDFVTFLLETNFNQPKDLEMSFVLEKDCGNFVYPTPYQLHYSEYHKPFYTNDMDAHINKMQGTDRDLAAHFTVINTVGITLYGKDRADVFCNVPQEYYLDSIKFDIEGAVEDIHHNPVYIILNLCRVLAYMENGQVLSKAGGGLWGMDNLQSNATTIEKAYNTYINGTDACFEKDELNEFACYMLKKIYK